MEPGDLEQSQSDERLFRGLRHALRFTIVLGVLMLGITYAASSWMLSTGERHADISRTIERAMVLADKLSFVAQQTASAQSKQYKARARHELTSATSQFASEIKAYQTLRTNYGIDDPNVALAENRGRSTVFQKADELIQRSKALNWHLTSRPGVDIPAELREFDIDDLASHLTQLRTVYQGLRRSDLVRFRIGALILVCAIFVGFSLQWALSYRPLSQSLQRHNFNLHRANARIKQKTLFDDVTGLPNRANLLHTLRSRVKDVDAIGILNIDLLRFREINEIFGWEVGDQVLTHIGKILSYYCEQNEYVARVGPNSFIVATLRRTTNEELADLADIISAGLGTPVRIAEHELVLTPVIGVSLRSKGTTDLSIENMLTNSQIALARAKSEGGTIVFKADMKDELAARRRTACELVYAFEREEIVPFFQPQIEAVSGRVNGFEALVRWQHPDRGLLGPAAFLDVCESANMTSRLTKVVVQESLAALAKWRSSGFDIDTVGINISPRELRDPEFADQLLFDIDRAGLEPRDVAVEVLETALIEKGDEPILDCISRLSSAGCRIDLDDFGTGHASLSNLLLFNIDRLKIDRSFVQGIHNAAERRKLTEAMLSLAAKLEIETLAEGVEGDEEWDVLAALGCNSLQGFGIGKPMPAGDVPGWIAKHHERIAGRNVNAA